MAKRHIVQYFLEVQNQYIEMLDLVKDIDEEVKKGNLEKERLDEVEKEIATLKDNYERIAYIIMLLNKPNRKDNKESEYTKKWYGYLKGASKEAIINEDKDCLIDLKKILEESKEKQGENK